MGNVGIGRVLELLVVFALTITLSWSTTTQEDGDWAEINRVRQIVDLRGEVQDDALKKLLAGRISDDAVFYFERQLRPALRNLLKVPDVSLSALHILTLIAEPEDLRFIINNPPVSTDHFSPNQWAYSVACSLLGPSSDEEWAFLQKCAANGFQDGWVDAGAIQTLKLIASPQSKKILQEAQLQNERRIHSIARALEFIESSPAPRSDADLNRLGELVAQMVKIGKWKGNNSPRFNEGRDKALIDFNFEEGPPIGHFDVYVYTASFCRDSGIWRLRGVRETRQELWGRFPDTPK